MVISYFSDRMRGLIKKKRDVMSVIVAVVAVDPATSHLSALLGSPRHKGHV